MAFLRVLCTLAIVALRQAIAEPTAACSANSNCAAAGLEGECCPTSGGEFLVCCDNNPVGGCAGTRYGCCPGTNLAAGPNNEGCHEEPVDPGRGDGVQDPGGCAVDITAGIASITSAAKFITYSVDDCPNSHGKVEAQRACADDITSAITDFAGSAKAIESATYTCGGVDTKCARDITNAIQSLSAASETLICAVSDCEEGADTYDAFACIVDIFDTTDTLIHLSKSIYDAVDNCGPVESVGAPQGRAAARSRPDYNEGQFHNKETANCAKNIGTATNSQLELHGCDSSAAKFVYVSSDGSIKVSGTSDMCVGAQARGGQFAAGSLVVLQPCSSAYKWTTKGGDTAVQMYGLRDGNFNLCIGHEVASNVMDRLVLKACDYKDGVMWNTLPISAPASAVAPDRFHNKETANCAKNIGTATNSQLELHGCDSSAAKFLYVPSDGSIKVSGTSDMCVGAQARGGQFAVGSLVVLQPCSSAYKWTTKGGDTAVQMYGLREGNFNLCIGHEVASNVMDRLVLKACDYKDGVMWNTLPIA